MGARRIHIKPEATALALSLDSQHTGLMVVFKDYEAAIIEALHKPGTKLSSRDALRVVKEEGIDKSRASVINFCNRMVDLGLFSYIETTGKGGHRRIYSARFHRHEFLNQISHRVASALERMYLE